MPCAIKVTKVLKYILLNLIVKQQKNKGILFHKLLKNKKLYCFKIEKFFRIFIVII